MSEIAISIRGLGKRYRIGATGTGYKTLSQTITQAVRSPFTRAAGIFRSKAEDSNRTTSIIWPLRNVDLDVKRGEVVGLIGHNGAGKTTLLKLLSRITEPSEGLAKIYGRVGSLLEVGTGFHPELTGRENIFLNGIIMGMTKSEITEKFDEIVDFAEVERFLDTPLKHYSSGMYIRLAFSVAAHLDTEILLVDEVLAVGDLSFQEKCLRKMEGIGSQGRTVIFVSHNMAAIRNLCAQCVWLKNGRIHKAGETDSIVNQYISESLTLSESGVQDLSTAGARIGVSKSVSSQASFESISLFNENGRMTNVFKEAEPLIFDLRFHSRVNANNFEIFLLVKSLDGVVIFTSYSEGIGRITKGNYQIKATIKTNPLRPGTYRVQLYLRTGDWQDIIPEAITFRVEAVPDALISTLLSHPALWGLVKADSVWGTPERLEEAEAQV